MAMPTTPQHVLRLSRAWRQRLRTDASALQISHVNAASPFLRPSTHCAALYVTCPGIADAAQRLGELLRLVQLMTAPHVDPLVLSTLLDDDALCAMAASPCTRCDSRCHSGIHWETLLAHTDANPLFRLVRVLPHGDALQVQSPQYAPVLTALVASGIRTRLPPTTPYQYGQTSDEAQRTWQWLVDWAEWAHTPPCVEDMCIARHPGQTAEMLATLFRLVVTENPTLRQLTLQWPLRLELDAEQRQRAASAMGAALLAPHASGHIEKLEMDVGTLTDDDVAALTQGMLLASDSGQMCSATSASDDDARPRSRPRFQSVKWMAHDTSGARVAQVVRLFGAVGVCELEIQGVSRGLPLRVLHAVLDSCTETITRLKWCGLACDDVYEWDDTPSTTAPRQLRDLCVFLPDGNDPTTLRAADVLLSHVGATLTAFTVSSYPSALPGAMAETILMHCPRLRTLGVVNASPQFFECLVQAYATGRCAISTIRATMKLGLRGVEWTPLFTALSDPTSGASRTLRSLTLEVVSMGGPQNGFAVEPLLEMLSANATLTRLELVGRVSPETALMLEALPLQFTVRFPSLRRRFALLSVFERRRNDEPQLAKLPPDVLGIVLAFAGRRVRRYKYERLAASSVSV